MLTIHGVPFSVHTRKVIVTAILKKMDYKCEVVIPVIPDKTPANWKTLSPTGLIPVLQEGDYTLPDSTAICLYLERKQPAPPILPSDAKDHGRALWFDTYAGGTIFRHLVHPLFVQTVVRPKIRKEATDKTVIGTVLNDVQPKILGYLESQIGGRFLVGDSMTLADIAIVSNFIVYQYLGYELDAAAYPKLLGYIRGITATAAFRKALDGEKPFVADLGLDRRFLEAA